jgi:ribosome assembly protein YihI (activator of Der GTPase)
MDTNQEDKPSTQRRQRIRRRSGDRIGSRMSDQSEFEKQMESESNPSPRLGMISERRKEAAW